MYDILKANKVNFFNTRIYKNYTTFTNKYLQSSFIYFFALAFGYLFLACL